MTIYPLYCLCMLGTGLILIYKHAGIIILIVIRLMNCGEFSFFLNKEAHRLIS